MSQHESTTQASSIEEILLPINKIANSKNVGLIIWGIVFILFSALMILSGVALYFQQNSIGIIYDGPSAFLGSYLVLFGIFNLITSTLLLKRSKLGCSFGQINAIILILMNIGTFLVFMASGGFGFIQFIMSLIGLVFTIYIFVVILRFFGSAKVKLTAQVTLKEPIEELKSTDPKVRISGMTEIANVLEMIFKNKYMLTTFLKKMKKDENDEVVLKAEHLLNLID